jgi:molybdenum cofactor synthesis domain-containing protein
MDRAFKAGVITISTKGSRGERKDDSGEIAAGMLERDGYILVQKKIVSDDIQQIADTIIEWVDNEGLSLIVTSGGTGLSPADVTPQAMAKVIDYSVPGIGEAMRAASLKKTAHAMLSRAIAGVRGSSLIINLPGSPKGVEENLSVVLPALKHGLSKLAGDSTDCAT